MPHHDYDRMGDPLDGTAARMRGILYVFTLAGILTVAGMVTVVGYLLLLVAGQVQP